MYFTISFINEINDKQLKSSGNNGTCKPRATIGTHFRVKGFPLDSTQSVVRSSGTAVPLGELEPNIHDTNNV